MRKPLLRCRRRSTCLDSYTYKTGYTDDQVMDSQGADYQARLANEESFYRESLVVPRHPVINNYWSEIYLRPKLRAAGFDSMTELYALPLAAACARPGPEHARFSSIGAGNCDVEIELAVALKAAGHSNIVI